LSEARPWRRWNRRLSMDQWLDRVENYAPYLRELVTAIDTCKSLSDTDDLVRQYDEWFHRTHRRLTPFQPEMDSVPDVPEWAVVARQAWLTARIVPEWWLEHRLAPTGEFGGRVGDDSDMYQNFLDSPMLEDGEFAQKLKQSARDLMALADQTTNIKISERIGRWLAIEHMKPGEYATSVEVATERVTDTTHRPLYGGHGGLGSAMLFMYWLTDDTRYIEPFMDVWRKGSDNTSPHDLLPEMFHRGALEPLGDEALQQLMMGRGIAEWLLTGDKQPLLDALKGSIAGLQHSSYG
jgi:hypothetical protein